MQHHRRKSGTGTTLKQAINVSQLAAEQGININNNNDNTNSSHTNANHQNFKRVGTMSSHLSSHLTSSNALNNPQNSVKGESSRRVSTVTSSTTANVLLTLLEDSELVVYERLFAAHVSTIAQDMLENILLTMSEPILTYSGSHHERKHESIKLQATLLKFLHMFLTTHQSDVILIRHFNILRILLLKYSSLLFSPSNVINDKNRCSIWWYSLIFTSSFSSSDTRDACSNFILTLLQCFGKQVGSLTRVRSRILIALRKVVDHINDRRTDYKNVGCLQTIQQHNTSPNNNTSSNSKHEKHDTTVPHTAIQHLLSTLNSIYERSRVLVSSASQGQIGNLIDIRDIFQRLLSILSISKEIHDINTVYTCSESRAERTIQLLSLIQSDDATMAIYYYKFLYDLYNGDGAEAGICQMRMANIIDTRMKEESSNIVANNGLFRSEHYVSCLKTASQIFEKCDCFELAMNAERKLIQHYEVGQHPALDLLADGYTRLTKLYKNLASVSSGGVIPSLSTYYRVGFHSNLFGVLDNREFIYREPSLTQLSEITTRLTNYYSTKLGVSVTVMKDSSKVDRSKLVHSQPKLQITNVTPVNANINIDKLDLTPHYLLSSNIAHFTYETPFTSTGKTHGSTLEQYKRRTTNIVSSAFPNAVKRLEIIEKHEDILNPIQCVLEVLKTRTKKLNEEAGLSTTVSRPPNWKPDLKVLYQLLSGSINTQVHGGTDEVCSSFLTKAGEEENETAKQYHADIKKELKLNLIEFFSVAGKALKIGRMLCGVEDKQFQELLDKSYESLVARCKDYLIE